MGQSIRIRRREPTSLNHESTFAFSPGCGAVSAFPQTSSANSKSCQIKINTLLATAEKEFEKRVKAELNKGEAAYQKIFDDERTKAVAEGKRKAEEFIKKAEKAFEDRVKKCKTG